jgi:hypothetical protein
MPTRLRSAAVLALVLATTACLPPDVPGTGSQVAPVSAWQHALDGIGTDGEVTKDVALGAFVAAFGPLPGVPAAEGRAGAVRSGTAALDMVLAHWGELEEPQRTAVLDLADAQVETEDAPPPPAAAPAPGPPPVAPPIAPGRGCVNDPAIRDRLSFWLANMQEKLGTAFAMTIDACSSTKHQLDEGREVIGWATSRHRPDRDTCHFEFFPPYAAASPDERDEVLAHEGFHCLENAIVGNDARSARLPLWIREGLAEWAAGAITTHYTAGWWPDYLDSPDRSLLKRSYDAVGFWWELDYRSVDVWGRTAGVLHAAADTPGSAADRTRAAFATVDVPGLLDSWPASFARDRERDLSWDTAGVGLPATPQQINAVPALVNGSTSAPITAEPFGTQLLAIEVNADVVQLQATGPARGRFGPGFKPKLDFTLSGALGQVFCTLGAKDCRCPEGSPKANATFQVIVPDGPKIAVVAVTGGPEAAAVTLTGTTIKDFCGEAKPKPKPAGGTGRVPLDCPPAGVLADAVAASTSGPVEARFAPGRWEYEGEVLPPKYGVTCGYHRWSTASFPDGLGHDVPVMLAQVALYLTDHTEPRDPGAEQAQVPGADDAWFAGGFLYAIVGGRTLGVGATVSGDPQETSVKIAAAVLAR